MVTRIYFNTGPFRFHDGFHYSPGLYQHAPASFIPVRGVCGEYATGGVFKVIALALRHQ